MNNNTQTEKLKTIKSRIKYSVSALLLLMAIIILILIQHVVSFFIAKSISNTTTELPLTFVDMTHLIVQQGEALSAYLNLLIGLPTSIILALLAIGLAFLAYRTSQQTDKRESRIYERETRKHVREQLHSLALQTDNILNKSRDLYDNLSALNRDITNGRWSDDFPRIPHMWARKLINANYINDIAEEPQYLWLEPDQILNYLDLSTSESSEWDRTKEDFWDINLYDVVKHNVKNVEVHEIHDYMRKRAEPKTPQNGFEPIPNSGFQVIRSYKEISNCERTESSLTRFLSEVATREILTQLNIFINVEHGGKKTSTELPNSIERACSDYFQETRKFFHEKIAHQYSLHHEWHDDETGEISYSSDPNEAIFGPLKQFFSHEELILWMQGKKSLTIMEKDQEKLAKLLNSFDKITGLDPTFTKVDALIVLVKYWCKNFGPFIADDRRMYSSNLPIKIRNKLNGLAVLLTLADCFDHMIKIKMHGQKVIRFKITSENIKLLKTLSDHITRFNQNEKQHDPIIKFPIKIRFGLYKWVKSPLKIRLRCFEKYAYFDISDLTKNSDLVATSTAIRRRIHEEFAQIYNDVAHVYGVKSKLNSNSITIGIGLAGDFTATNISNLLIKYQRILDDLMGAKKIKRSFFRRNPSMAMRRKACSAVLEKIHTHQELADPDENIVAAISKFKDFVEAIGFIKRVPRDQQKEGYFGFLSREILREVLIDEVAKTSNANYHFNRSKLLSMSKLLSVEPNTIFDIPQIKMIAEALYRSQEFELEDAYTFLRSKHNVYTNDQTIDTPFEIIPKYSSFHIITLLLYCDKGEAPKSIIRKLHHMSDFVEACEIIAKDLTIPTIFNNSSFKETVREICNIDHNSKVDMAIFENEYNFIVSNFEYNVV